MTALPMPSTSARRPRGFTLVELLVVVAIVAMLAALVTPAVIRARSAARNAAIDTEIDLLHMAIMNYRNEYGSFPPCSSPLTSGSAMARHLQRLFPRCDVANHLVSVAAAGGTAITPQNALVSWLGGYTLDPTSPLLPQASRRKLFDFDQARVAGGYAPAGQPNARYLYIDSSQYASLQYSGNTAAQLAVAGAHYMPASPLPAKPNSSTPDAWFFTNTSAPAVTTQQFYNPDTFQILCAGANGVFGDDDDLSNFWSGTRKQHLDRTQSQ
jgi:prepilin-type N-terminal cleavage/methylation domain-containing protein